MAAALLLLSPIPGAGKAHLCATSSLFSFTPAAAARQAASWPRVSAAAAAPASAASAAATCAPASPSSPAAASRAGAQGLPRPASPSSAPPPSCHSQRCGGKQAEARQLAQAAGQPGLCSQRLQRGAAVGQGAARPAQQHAGGLEALDRAQARHRFVAYRCRGMPAHRIGRQGCAARVHPGPLLGGGRSRPGHARLLALQALLGQAARPRLRRG